MPRSGWRKPTTDRRLSDLVSVGLLTRVFPPDLVDEVIADAGRRQQRSRVLPARVVAYFTIAMALNADGSYEDVFADLVDGLSWASGWEDEYPCPSASAISQARARLGAGAVEALFRTVTRPLAREEWADSWLAGRRLLAIDGTTLDVADTPVNEAEFGRPGVGRGEQAAYPQARVVAVAETGTHAVVDATIGDTGTGETTLARQLIDRLRPGVVLTADRGFYSFRLWQRAADTGADLLWRVRSNVKPRHIQTLADGTWLAEVSPTSGPGWRKIAPLRVRVIDYEITTSGDTSQSYRLLTTLTDTDEAVAEDLAAAYHHRWEIESVFDELKTHQRGPRIVLRSKSPELVRQEIWGHLCCHYAIRALMADTASHSGHDPGRISFVKALCLCRRSLTQGSFSP